jgi:uncharacterized protein
MDMRRLGSAWWVAWLWVAGVSAAPGDAALVDAVKAGNRESVRALLQQSKRDVNAREVDGTTALHWAVQSNDLESVRLLLRAGADARAANRYGVTPLTLAAVNGSAPVIEALVKAGADVNATLPEGETVLMTAARTGDVAAVRMLLAHGADVNAKEARFGETPLIWAATQNHGEAIKALVESGAAIDARSALTSYPKLMGPLQTGDPKGCPGGQGLQTNCLPRGGWTPLMYAAREGATEAVGALTMLGADVNAADPDGLTPLMIAIWNGHYDIASTLLDMGADPNHVDKYGMGPLYEAVNMNTLPATIGRPGPKPTDQRNALDIVKMLLEHGADPNAELKAAIRPRHHSNGDATLGAGTTPLMRAAKQGDVALLRLLLDKGADLDRRQRNTGNTALMIAAGFGSRPTNNDDEESSDRGTQADAIEAIKLCIERGADIHALNWNGETSLFIATGEAIIRFLVAQGLKLDDYNYNGQTALDAWLGRRDRDGKLTRPATVAVLRELMNGGASANVARPH